MTRLAVFGAYSDDDLYQRNRSMVQVLASLAGETRILRPAGLGKSHGFAAALSGWGRLRRLLGDTASLLRLRFRLRDCDTIFVPYPAYLPIALLWLSGALRGRRLLVDAFLDLYSTVVEDRGLLPVGSLRARLLAGLQRGLLSRASLVFIDTEEHRRMLGARLAPSEVAIAAIPVGIDESQWRVLDAPPPQGHCHLLFWGTFIPLHGIPTILQALRLLEARGLPVKCRIVGDGQAAPEVAADLASRPIGCLRWERRLLPVAALRDAITGAHVVLGIFGESGKAGAVVPYKVHQGLACNRPLITRGSGAMDAHADAQRGLITVPAGDPLALADAVEALWGRLCDGWKPTTRAIYDASFSDRAVERAVRQALVSRGLL